MISFDNNFWDIEPLFPISSSIIAAFWTHLSAYHNEGVIFFRQTFDSNILDRANTDVSTYFQDFPPGTFSATWVFVITWYNLPYCCQCTDLEHVWQFSFHSYVDTYTFQVVFDSMFTDLGMSRNYNTFHIFPCILSFLKISLSKSFQYSNPKIKMIFPTRNNWVFNDVNTYNIFLVRILIEYVLWILCVSLVAHFPDSPYHRWS